MDNCWFLLIVNDFWQMEMKRESFQLQIVRGHFCAGVYSEPVVQHAFASPLFLGARV